MQKHKKITFAGFFIFQKKKCSQLSPIFCLLTESIRFVIKHLVSMFCFSSKASPLNVVGAECIAPLHVPAPFNSACVTFFFAQLRNIRKYTVPYPATALFHLLDVCYMSVSSDI